MKTVDQSPRMHSRVIETAKKGQQFQLKDNRPGAVAQAKLIETIQCIRRAPQPGGGATVIGDPVDAPYRDTVAPGPAHVSSYNIGVTALSADRNTALGAIRTVYRSMGGGYQNEKFLASASLFKKCEADRDMAARVYDRFAAGGVAMGAAVVGPNANAVKIAKAGYINANKATLNTSANLDHLRDYAKLLEFCDPVEVHVRAAYGAAAPLVARVDFSEGQKGYITNIMDSGGVDASIADRPNYAGEFPRDDPGKQQLITDGAVEVDNIDSYSNVHHVGIDEDAGTQIARVGTRDTRLNLEAGLDAMTKVIAEGGRFRCVEALGMALKNSSLFYAPKLPQFRTVDFKTLWGMWQTSFKGVYGVDDATILGHIVKDPLPKNVVEVGAEPAATGHNYNLDTRQIQ